MKRIKLSCFATALVALVFFLSFGAFALANETPDLSKDLVSYGNTNLAAVTGTQTGLWNQTTIDGKSDVWYYGDPASKTYDTGGTTKGDLTMTFDTKGLTSASLELDTKYKTESGTTYDTCQIMIGSDVLWQRTNSESKDSTGSWGWESLSLPLDSYIGNDTVEVIFQFNSKDNIANSYFGWALDNITLSSTGSSSTSTPTSTSGLIINQIDMGNFPSVDIYLSVNDSNGDFVSTLTTSDFNLKESGSIVDPFTVSLLQSQTAALSLGLVVDESGSMSGSMDDAKTAVKDFIGLSTGAQNQFSIVSIGSKATSAVNQVTVIQDFTTDIQTLTDAVDPLTPSGMTPLYDGIAKSLELTALQPGIKAVIAFTDGSDTYSKAYSTSSVISYAKTLGVSVYTIGIGYVNDTDLIAIANQTGGFYTKANSIADLNTIYNSIQGTILKQYQLSFTSNLTSSDNACYDIEATLPDGSVVSSIQCEVIPSPPQISLDSNTKNMIQTAPAWNDDLTIGAIITDPDGDDIKAVNLYYRTKSSSDSFTKLAMSVQAPTDSSLFTVTIPGTDYADPGIEFYLTASDGINTRTEPAKDYFTIGDDVPPPPEQIYLLSPKNNAVMSYGATTGNIDFVFTKVSSVAKYVLHIELNDLLNGYSIPIALDLIPPSSAASSDPWGTGGTATSTATPGFIETFIGMTLSLNMDTATWDTLAKYDLTWGVEAYDSNNKLIGSTSHNNVATKYINKLKLLASNAIALTSPAPGMTLDKQDSPPVFKWELYQGVSTYTLILAHESGLGFDKVIDIPGLTLNVFSMDDSTWASMPTNQWYWTVLGNDAAGSLTPLDFTIFDFEIK